MMMLNAEADIDDDYAVGGVRGSGGGGVLLKWL